MSKTVIVFSTRLISPFTQNGLFSETHIKRKSFSSSLLADFFWNDIREDDSFLKSILDNMFDSKNNYTDSIYSLNEAIELSKYIKRKQEYFKAQVDHFSPNDFSWVRGFLASNAGKQETIIRELMKKHAKLEAALKRKMQKSTWISEHLKDDLNADQRQHNIGNDENKKPGPWLSRRFSYYELKKNPKDDISVYAIWPLAPKLTKDNDNEQWVKALSDQFLSIEPDAKEFYLILHDEDIERSIFTLWQEEKELTVTLENQTTIQVSRYIALFQHVDAMGAFLGDPRDSSPNGVKLFVEEMVNASRFRKLLGDTFDYIVNDNATQLLINANKLTEYDKTRFNEILDIAQKIEKSTSSSTQQSLDKLKLELIQLLNREFNKFMIETNPKTNDYE